jgi:hypothetical protein
MLSLVSLTDRRWFDHLSACARRAGGRLDEVNFWRPRDQHAVRSIEPGAPFFLRLKTPVNAIAGFGFFAHWQLVPFLDAWALFGEKNGAPTLSAFREQIRSLRRADPLVPGAAPLGCIVRLLDDRGQHERRGQAVPHHRALQRHRSGVPREVRRDRGGRLPGDPIRPDPRRRAGAARAGPKRAHRARLRRPAPRAHARSIRSRTRRA